VCEEKPPESKIDVRPVVGNKPDKITRTSTPQQTGDGSPPTTCKSTYPYTIHVSSYQDKKKSNHVADELREQGAPAFACPVYIPGKGDWNRVFVGYYQTIEETRKAASKLRGKHYLHPIVTKMPYAVQIGILDSGHDLKKLEVDLRSKAYLAYSIPDRKDFNKTRLLIGAYKSEKDAAGLIRKLEEEGFNPKVVQR
jgi:cell division septation protein DedD